MKKVTGFLCFMTLSIFCTGAWAKTNVDRINAITSEADRGDAAAQTQLGILYVEGDGVTRDYKKARAWFERAGKQNYADAEYNLGVMYSNGDGVARDNEKARHWFEKAAVHGHIGARYNLGIIYSQGVGIPKDLVRSEFWFTLAAQQGLPEDKYALGVMYSNGDSLPKNDAKARQWFEIAAKEGIVLAQYNIAVMYSEGLGGERDLEKARRWANKAAEQGDPEAAGLLTLLNKNDSTQKKSAIGILLMEGKNGLVQTVSPVRLPSQQPVEKDDVSAVVTENSVNPTPQAVEADAESSIFTQEQPPNDTVPEELPHNSEESNSAEALYGESVSQPAVTGAKAVEANKEIVETVTENIKPGGHAESLETDSAGSSQDAVDTIEIKTSEAKVEKTVAEPGKH